MSFPSYVTLLNIGISKSLHFPANPIIVTFFVAELDLIVAYAPNLRYPFICWRTFRLTLSLHYCHHSRSKNTQMCKYLYVSSQEYSQECYSRIHLVVQFSSIHYYYWETSMLISIMTGLSKVFFWFICWALLRFLDIFIIFYLPIVSPFLDPQLQVDIWPSVVISLLANVLFMLSYFS